MPCRYDVDVTALFFFFLLCQLLLPRQHCYCFFMPLAARWHTRYVATIYDGRCRCYLPLPDGLLIRRHADI